MSVVFRVQDREGRGPFRPGFSRMWIDTTLPAPLLPTWMEEFGGDVFDRLGKPGEHYGSACRSLDDLHRWFAPSERQKLEAFGFSIVAFKDARILASSPNQCVFARSTPLSIGGEVRRWT